VQLFRDPVHGLNEALVEGHLDGSHHAISMWISIAIVP